MASALANLLHNDASSPVDATASGAMVNLTTRSAGVASDYSFSVSSATTDSSFSGASFPITPGSGSLTGGVDAFHYSFNLGYAGNGNVLSANDSVNGNWTYTYDSFNRLATSNKNSGQSGYSYVYDQFGNRWQQNVTAGTGNSMILTFSGSNNRMDGYSYDAAGNLLNDGHHSYTYDAENRIISVDNGQTASYVYDAEGRRVRKASAPGTVDYLYDLAGHAIVELNSSGGWNRAEVFAASRHLATYSGGTSGTTLFAHTDWLGTERARTNMAGAMCETVISLPFGDGETTSGTCDPSPLHFTGKERDLETGLDYFGARYYSSSLARFASRDPKMISRQRMFDPQQWNAYQYSRNNPTTYFDPDGRELRLADGLSKSDANRIIHNLASAYRKESGRTAINNLAKSDITYVYGTGKLPDTKMNLPNGGTLVQERFATTSEDKERGTVDAKGNVTSIVRDQSTVDVIFDFGKLDKASADFLNGKREQAPPTEQHVNDHELGHQADIDKDPVAERNESTDQAERNAESFANSLEKEKNTMSQKEAEKEIRI